MARILIVDDDPLVCDSLSNVVRRLGHDVACGHTIKEGMELARSEEFDLVLLDVRLPDGSGLDLLPEIRNRESSPEVIIMTGFGDPDGAELAINHGAWDYLEKPLSVRQIRLPLERALMYQAEKQKQATPVHLKRDGIIGRSPQVAACLDVLAQAANSEANILIQGETGTGKELFAWAIHDNSPRANKNFVVVDCAALPETLVESVLFGHRKGAFTGADRAQEGLIKQADHGTLFLDEIGELPLSVQKSFLRVLQEKRFRPVGGSQEVRSSFRLVAATNRDLEEEVRMGRFREDLLHRLRTLVIQLPALREIREDIEELVLYYLGRLSRQYGMDMKGISPGFWEVLYQYDWPGNTRELIQALERALVSAQQASTLYVKHLPPHIRIKVVQDSVEQRGSIRKRGSPSHAVSEGLSPIQQVRDDAVAEVESKYLTDLMEVTRGDIKKACGISGLSRSRLYTLLKKYHISPSP